ncbi:MAG TPA: methyl-accepting chemotaxis protein [Ktedonobacterales bacterium]|jgi:methyl-accepting chemotaxis protein
MVNNWVPRRGPDRDMERRVRQIRELVRLSNTLRVDLGLQEILLRLADAVTTTIGFGVAAFNLVCPNTPYMEVAAVVGLSPEEYERLRQAPPELNRVLAIMRPECCVSHSYFIPHQYQAALSDLMSGMETILVAPPPPAAGTRVSDTWDAADMLLVPLVSGHTGALLGVLSLDQPQDGKVPSQETIEVVELFANQAAAAIDMARHFDERERDHRVLQAGVEDLLRQMEEVGRGNLAVRADLAGTPLSPMAEAMNTVLLRLSGVLHDVREASEVVTRSAAAVQASATQLVAGAHVQERQIREVSSAVAGMAAGVRHISETAAAAAEVASEAITLSHDGGEAAVRAAAGMSAVREMTLQSAKRIKRLGESTQEIGEIAQLASDFADQTRLLAVNASIEAARAGDHGSGFSIVAQEVRTLATNSADAAKAIRARIQGIQSDTSAVVVTIEESTRQVVIQSELAAHAGAALEAVDIVTQRIAAAIEEITGTAGRQAQAASTIARSMADISDITTRTRDSMERMHGSMEQLAHLARSVLGGISVFQLEPAYAAPALTSNGDPAFSGVIAPTGWTAGPAMGAPAGVPPPFPYQSGQLSYQSGPLPVPSGPLPLQSGQLAYPSGPLYTQTDTTQPMTMPPPETWATPSAQMPTGDFLPGPVPPLGSGALPRPTNSTRPATTPGGANTALPNSPNTNASIPIVPERSSNAAATGQNDADPGRAAFGQETPVSFRPPWPR